MSTVVRPLPESLAAAPTRSLVGTRLADYLELTKPRIAVLALVTVAVGYWLGTSSVLEAGPLWPTLLGVALVAASASGLNQWFERHSDARMERTQDRPLPAGRLSSFEALCFSAVCGVTGVGLLWWQVNAVTAGLALLTLVLYAGVYTPLKPVTYLNTVIGAIPGALPPVLGWTAATGELSPAAGVLFAILFLWQFPHFMAIAWIYRLDYARAGLKMLPVAESGNRTAGLVAVGYALALLPVSLLPAQWELAGLPYVLAAVLLGCSYLLFSIRFCLSPNQTTARGLLWNSLVYLPVLFVVLVADHFRLLS